MNDEEKLVHYIKSHNDHEIKKGLGLFTEYSEDIFIYIRKRTTYTIDVPSQRTDDSYEVKLNVLSKDVIDKCQCAAYKKYGQCKHAIAAALALLQEEYEYSHSELEEMIEAEVWDGYKNKNTAAASEKIFTAKKQKTEKPQPPSIPSITQKEWKKFTKKGILTTNDLDKYSGYCWHSFSHLEKIVLNGFNEKELQWTFFLQEKKQEVSQEIKYDAKESYYYRCSCNFKGVYDMCKHVRLAFDKLLYSNRQGFFATFRDWTQEKNNLLKPYSLTIADEEASAFTFTVGFYGDLQMQAPPAFIKGGDKEQLKKLSRLFKSKETIGATELIRPRPLPGTIIDFETAFVLNANSQRLKIGFELEAAKLYRKQQKIDLKKLSVNQPANLSLFKELSDEVYGLLLQLSDNSLLDYLQMKGHGYLKNYGSPWQQMTDASIAILKTHYIECLQKLWPHLAAHPENFLLQDGKFSSINCKPVSFSTDTVEISFAVKADERFITVWQIPLMNNKPLTDGNVKLLHDFIFSVNGVLHIIKNIEDLPVIEQFRNGFIKVAADSKYDVIQNIIAPLQERYDVQLPEGFELKTIHPKPLAQVLLKEFSNQYLMLQPQFLYEETEVDYSNNPEDILITLPSGSLQIMKRDAALEKQFFETARPSSLLKRFIEPKEIADLVAFVCSPLSLATNGAALRVEGGVVRSMV